MVQISAEIIGYALIIVLDFCWNLLTLFQLLSHQTVIILGLIVHLIDPLVFFII